MGQKLTNSSISQPLDFRQIAATFPSSSSYAKTHGWAAIAGVAILGFGKEECARDLCTELLAQTEENSDVRMSALRKLREAFLKASPLVGFPRSIKGLSILRKAITELAPPEVNSSLARDKSLRDLVSLEDRQTRGKEFFSRIYSQHTDRVLQNLNDSSGGDLGEFAINCIYGDLVAETSILDAKETGLLEFTCCLTLGAANQTKGHMFGAHNLGNNGQEIDSAVKTVEGIAQQLEIQWSSSSMQDFLIEPREKGW